MQIDLGRDPVRDAVCKAGELIRPQQGQDRTGGLQNDGRRNQPKVAPAKGE